MQRIHRFVVTTLLVAAMAVSAFAQTTATLQGSVTTEGAPLPGATVTISSPSLQGTRTAVTSATGAYIFPGIPPGQYNVTFELEGMQTVSKQATVQLAQTARADADLRLSSVSEAITVTATAPAVLETTELATTFTSEQVENLPINRTVLGAAAIAPGVSDEGPNNQLIISGAPSYENVYLVNGAVVNDTLRGQPEAVFIEDAIEETTVLTGNVSAEYGRFTGGVISTITKSGGNEFSGSLRSSFTNDDWTGMTPYAAEAEKVDKVAKIYEATLGGRIIRDRLWFFAAGRLDPGSETANTTLLLNKPYVTTIEEERWEGKLTGQITSRHSLVGSYLDRLTTQSNYGQFLFVDEASLTSRELPNSIMSVNYNGILTNNFLLEAGYSEREFAFVGGGATTTDRIFGTIVRDYNTGYRGFSPTFCGNCAPKTRDNEYARLKGSYFLSTSSLGNHNIVGGYEDFSDLIQEDNEQGGSGYRVWGEFVNYNDTLYLRVVPGTSWIQNYPILNSSLRSDNNTQSLFVNDKWDLNEHFSFNLGVRYDQNDSIDQAGNKTSDDEGFSPRLSAIYDVLGDGRHRISAGYNRYQAKLDAGINDSASNAGSPAYFGYDYFGPALNVGVEGDDLLSTEEVLTQVFAWFDSIGGDVADPDAVTLPGVSTQLDGELDSPYMDEYSIGYGTQIGARGFLRADYMRRDWANFYVDRTSLDTGRVTDELGNEFDLTLVGNDDDDLERTYDAVQLQGGYRFSDRINFGGNYTWSELKGNADSETSNNATITLTSADSYTEYIDPSWNNRTGYLSGDVRHRANIWASYDLPTPVGNFNFSLLQRFHSGFAYSGAGTVSLREADTGIPNPGYVDPPTTATYYFSERGAFRTDDVFRTDLGLNWALPIGPASLFVQGDVLNVFDNDDVEDPTFLNTTVLTGTSTACIQNGGGRCAYFNPKTTAPVEGVNYQYHTNFGQPTSALAYQLPLTYRVSVGVRF